MEIICDGFIEAAPFVLTEGDIEQFKEEGFICLRQVFSAETAYHCRNELWAGMIQDGIDPSDPRTWTRKKSVGCIHQSSDGYPWYDIISSRLTGAIDTICGKNRWIKPFSLGWWTISFPGYHSDSTWGIDGHWHVDGSFVHFPFSKDIGLTAIMLFSDVHDDIHGATTVLKGSHKYISKVITEAGVRGLSGYQIRKILDDCEEDWEVAQLSGQAGDVYLMHPFLVHARSKNVGQYGDLQAVRFICHPAISLKDDMNFCKKDMSPLEQSIFDSAALTDGYNPLFFLTPKNVKEFEEMRIKKSDGEDHIGGKRKFESGGC